MRGARSWNYLGELQRPSARVAFAFYLVGSKLRLPALASRALANRVTGLVKSARGLFWLRPNTLDFLMAHPGHELETRTCVSTHLCTGTPAGVFLDVGAHCGTYAISFASCFEQVFAVEPDQDNFSALLRNISLNGLEKKVTGVCTAAGDEDGVARLFRRQDDTHSLDATQHYRDESAVPMTRLDTLVRKLVRNRSRITLLKIDVEGAELRVLAGARELLVEHQPMVIAEAHNETSRQQLCSFLAQFGYDATPRVTDIRNLIFEPIIAKS